MIHFGAQQSRGLSLRCRAPDVKTWGEGSRLWCGPLDAKCCDEDIDHDYDEHEGCGYVFQDIQLVVLAFIVQVPLNCKRKIPINSSIRRRNLSWALGGRPEPLEFKFWQYRLRVNHDIWQVRDPELSSRQQERNCYWFCCSSLSIACYPNGCLCPNKIRIHSEKEKRPHVVREDKCCTVRPAQSHFPK